MIRGISAAAISVGLLLTGACKQQDTDKSSAAKQVEQAQRESEAAFDAAKQAQEKARKEQADVVRAEEKVADKQRELAEAQAKLAEERSQAEAAQTQALTQGQQATQHAQSAQARAAQAQQQARTEAEQRAAAKSEPAKSEPATTTETTPPAPPTATTESTKPAPVTTPDHWAQPSQSAQSSGETQAREAPMQPRTTSPTSAVRRWIDKAQEQVQQQPQRAHDEAEVLQNDEGVVKSVTADEIVLQRDNGSEIELKTVQSLTMPTAGQRVAVQYRLDGTQPVAVRIDVK